MKRYDDLYVYVIKTHLVEHHLVQINFIKFVNFKIKRSKIQLYETNWILYFMSSAFIAVKNFFLCVCNTSKINF